MSNHTTAILSEHIYVLYSPSEANSARRGLFFATFGAVVCVYLLYSDFTRPKTIKVPFVGFRSAWEPKLLVRLRYSRGALAQITEGYNKCKSGLFENGMFKIARNDSDILIISNKFVDELCSLPIEKLSAMRAHVKNLNGKFSTLGILLNSDLHTRMLQRKLTPSLGKLVSVIESELKHGMDVDLPKNLQDWQNVYLNEALQHITARISARVFIGEPYCRNEEWLQTSIEYTTNVFTTVMLLRPFPAWTHPLIVNILPSYWRLHENVRIANKLIVPIVEHRRAKEAENDPDYTKSPDVLQWMMDATDATDEQPHKLAHHQLILSFASIITSSMAILHALYDLCAHPEYFEPLIEESEMALAEDGGWQKSTHNKMRKLDSFLKESQRVNPPSLLAFHREIQADLTLSNGLTLPKGTFIAMPSAAILQDNDIIEEADSFNGFRYFTKRQDPKEANRHQFGMTDENNLNFGHGKYSCPGRFFACKEIKMVMVQLLIAYEFKYPPGQTRPKNLTADDFLYPDPSARLMMRKRVP